MVRLYAITPPQGQRTNLQRGSRFNPGYGSAVNLFSTFIDAIKFAFIFAKISKSSLSIFGEGTRVRYLCSMQIHGKPTDTFTRCQHYHSPLDIIAIKFKCCNNYYACIHCHEETAEHNVVLWPKEEWHTKAIICGACKTEMSINEYFNCEYKCPNCSSAFNPKCSNHNHFYFETQHGSQL